LRNKKVLLAVAVAIPIILTAVFLSLPVLNQKQQEIPVVEIMRDPSSWVGKNVAVEGILVGLPQANPTFYGMYSENRTASGYNNAGMGPLLFVELSLNFNGAPTRINEGIVATVHGVIREKVWADPKHLIPDPNNPGSYTTAPGQTVYYIEPEKVELLGPTVSIP
jgi:hypothetical protein